MGSQRLKLNKETRRLLLVCPPVLLPPWLAMLLQLLMLLPQLLLTDLPQLPIRLRPTLMRSPPTHTPMLLLMTTQRLNSVLRSPLMVLELLKDLTLLLFLMAESKLLHTLPMVMMDMLLMSMKEQLNTQRLLPTRLLQLMPQPPFTRLLQFIMVRQAKPNS